MRGHRHIWMASDRSDVLGCVDCGAMCTWDPADRDTHPDAARRPVAGWVRVDDAYFLPGPIECMTHEDEHASDDAPWFWALRADTSEGRLILIVNGDQILGHRPTLAAAQLAAEDALRAIAAEILRAVGK